MNRLKSFFPLILIVFIVLIFFFPLFKGSIPFPGDLLVNSNPYSTQSFMGYNPGSYPNKAQGPDVITEIYPWRYFAVSQVKQGEIPFWNPYNFSGNPQMANYQTGVFYPLNFIYLILPFNLSWSILILLQPLLAALFMFLFLKKGLNLKDPPSVIGAISFGFSSYMSVWMEYANIGHTILWLPLILFFTKKLSEKISLFSFLGISISLLISFLAGYIQGVFYIYILSFFYYVFLIFSKKDYKAYKRHLLFLVSLIIPLFISAFQIFPTLLLFSESTRGAYTLSQIERNLAPIYSYFTIIFPDFFGNPATRNYWIDGTYIERVMYPGTIIFIFSVFAILKKIKIPEKKFFLIVSVISLVIATNLPFVKYFYLIPIPVISTTVATRELSIFIFSLIILGSIGIDYLLSSKENHKKYFVGIFLFYLILWGIVVLSTKLGFNFSESLKISIRNMIIPTGIVFGLVAAVFLKKINKNIFYILLILLVSFDLFYFFTKITPFAPSSFTYPKSEVNEFIKTKAGINRFWGYGSGYISPNFQSVDGIYSPEGNDPLHIVRYTEILSSSNDGKIPHTLPRPDANIAPGYGQSDLKNNFYRKRVLDLLGVKYILHKVDMKDSWNNPDLETFPKDKFDLVYKTYPWQVYENKDSINRFFISSDYVLAKNRDEALNFIYDKNIDLKKTIILEEETSVPLNKNIKGNVKLVSYTPNKIVFDVKTSDKTLLFLSDNYYPEWGAKIDSKDSRILIADYSFRAVEVGSGSHRVEFFYKAKTFKLGLKVSLIGLLIILITSFYAKKIKDKK
jgi:uncharacterized membrane protein YfhO